MMDTLRGVFGIVFLLGFAILVHEFGHFVWAKVCGVKVLKFSIGFGKFIFSWKWGETQYGVAWFPVGGYVMLHGAMNPETGQAMEEAVETAVDQVSGKEETTALSVEAGAGTETGAATPAAAQEPEKKGGLQRMVDAATSDSTALCNKPYRHKLLIYGGGVAMNWVTAVVAIGLIWSIGFDHPKPPGNVVGHVGLPASVAPETVPLESGDRIVKADGHAVEDWLDFLQAMGVAMAAEEKTGKPADVKLVVDRPGEGEKAFSIPALVSVEGEKKSPALYVEPHRAAYIEGVIPNKPADKAGIQQGDTIVAVDGKPIHSWGDMAEIVQANPGTPLAFEVERGGETLSMTVVPVEDPDNPGRGQVGIVQGNPDRLHEQEPVVTAFKKAPLRTVETTVIYVGMVGDIFKRLAHLKFRSVGDELGGPIQIAQLAYRSAKRGLVDFLQLFYIFNIALVVFNLLPIPLLDGSLLFFATYEKIVGKPFPPRLHVPLLYAGLALIVLIFIVVSVHDVFRVFG